MKQEKGRTAAFEDVGKKVLRTATALVEQKAREQLGREGLEHNLGKRATIRSEQSLGSGVLERSFVMYDLGDKTDRVHTPPSMERQFEVCQAHGVLYGCAISIGFGPPRHEAGCQGGSRVCFEEVELSRPCRHCTCHHHALDLASASAWSRHLF